MDRTDNDTWDLATSVGATMVAAARAIATNAADPIIEDRFAEPLVRAVGVDFFTRWATGELDATGVDSADAPWGLQQMTDLLAARTRNFDAFFVDATAAGIRQAVILASGLDAGQPTAWIAEGLLAFLPPDAQDRLLDTITDLSADGSRLATETFGRPADADTAEAKAKMEDVMQRWRDHGFDLEFGDLGYDGDRNDVESYLDGLGWRSVRTPLMQLLAANGLRGMPETGDRPAFADNYYCSSILHR